MRILQVIPSITNYFTFLDELTEACQHEGIEMALAASPQHFYRVSCYDSKPRCQYFPIGLPQGMNPLAHLKAAGALRRVVESWRPDVIHAHIGAGIFSVSLARRKHWPTVVATHHGLLGPSMPGIKGKLGAFAEAWTFGKVDAAFLLNESDFEWMQRKGKRTDNVSVYQSRGLGCRTEVFDPAQLDPEAIDGLRRDLGIADDDVVFIFVGRHVWFKGYDLVAKAFMRFHEAHPNAKLLLLGEPYTVHPTGLSTEENERFRSHPAVIRVGWVDHVQDYLALAHINLFPSQREGMPVNLMESLSMGVPVITSNTRGCNEVVSDGHTGILLSDLSVEALVAAMKQLVQTPSLLATLRSNALQQRSTLDRRCWIREQIELYRSIGSRDRATPLSP